MEQPILHIGFPKTASTWFQDSFYLNVSNICYLPRNNVQELFLKPGAFDWNEEDSKKQLKLLTGNDSRRLVICEELLLGRLRPGGVKHFVTKEVANRLKIIFPKALIVLFIRNQLDAIASAYMQYIQSGGNYGIKKFIFPERISGGDYNSLVLLGKEYFQYHRVVDYYSTLYGKENIHIYLYEEFCNSNSQFIAAFKERYDFSVDEKLLSFQRVNEGYRSTLIAPRKFCNAFTRKGPLNKYYLMHLPYADHLIRIAFSKANKLKFLGNRKSAHEILGSKNAEYFQSYYKQSNKILLEKYGLTGIVNYNYPL